MYKLIMVIDDNFRDEKLQDDISRETLKDHHYHQEQLINMDILQTKKCYLLIKE